MKFASFKSRPDNAPTTRNYRLRFLCVLVAIFLLAALVRFLTWQDNDRDIGKVQTSVTEGYKDSARRITLWSSRYYTLNAGTSTLFISFF